MKVIIVDDDQLVTLSLKTILEAETDFEVVATHHNGEEVIQSYLKHQPDIVLMDIRMEPYNGIDIGKLILLHDQDARILYLTTFKDDEYLEEALKMGAKGYLLKQDFASVASSLRAVFNHQSVFYNEAIAKIPKMFKQSDFKYRDHELSQQEYHVLKLIAEGLNNKEIAKVMFLSEGTVRNYISQLLSKLELRDRTQLAIFYYQNT